MYSDDEAQEFALEVKKLYTAKVPAASLGQREVSTARGGMPSASVSSAIGPQARTKDPSVTCVHYDTWKKRLFYGLDNGACCFWSITHLSAGKSRFVGSHKGPISAICSTSKDDTNDLGCCALIATGSVDMSIKLWDYQGKVTLDPTVCVQSLYGHSGTITALVIKGGYILSSSTDKTIRVWRPGPGREQLIYPWYELQATVSAHDGWIRGMSYDTSGVTGDLGTVYAADESGGIIKLMPDALWDEDAQRLSSKLEFRVHDAVAKVHDRGVSHIRYVAKWGLVLTLAYDQCLRAYDTHTNTVRHCWQNESRCQWTALEVELEFDEVLVCDVIGLLSIYSITSGRLMATKRVTPQGVPVTAISRVLDRQLYAIFTAKDCTLWHIEHELDYNLVRGGHDKAVIGLYSCSGGVAGATGDQDYRIFSASVDNTLRVWDPYDMACIRVLEEQHSEITAMTYYEGWNLLVTGHDSGHIRLWNLDTSSTTTLKQHTNAVQALQLALIHRNEELLISAGFDGWVILWDIRSLRGEEPYMVAKFKAHGTGGMGGSRSSRSLRSLAAAMRLGAPSPAGAPPTTASGDGRGSLSQITSAGLAPGSAGTLLAADRADSASSSSLLNTLATSIVGGGKSSHRPLESACSGEAAPGRSASPTFHGGMDASPATTSVPGLNGPEPEILALRYDPNKKVIITGGTDKLVKVWSTSGYDFLGYHSGHKDAVTCLALDANFLFSGSDDCTICLWDTVPAATLLRTITGMAGTSTGARPAAVAAKATFTSYPLKVLCGHECSVTGLELLPGNGYLVSCSLDGTLRVWDYVAGTVLHKYTSDTEEFRCISLRYDRSEILVGTLQANILRYPMPEPPSMLACAAAGALPKSASPTGSSRRSTPLHSSPSLRATGLGHRSAVAADSADDADGEGSDDV